MSHPPIEPILNVEPIPIPDAARRMVANLFPSTIDTDELRAKANELVEGVNLLALAIARLEARNDPS